MSAPPPTPPPPAVAPPPADRGTLSHALGFLAFIPLPFVGLLIAGIAMLASYPSVRRRGPVAALTGRSGANWGGTVLVLMLLIVVSQIILASIAAATDARGFLPTGTPIIVYLVLAVVHVVVTIVGTVRASNGQEFRNPLAIPFFRAP